MKTSYFKNTCLIIAAIILNLNVQGQYSNKKFKNKDFIQFFSTKTMVVLDTNEAYNEAIKKAMKETWDLTTFDFISTEEFNKSIGNPSLSFIFPLTIGEYNSNEGLTINTGLAYDKLGCYLVCVLGGGKIDKKGKTNYGTKDFIGYAPIDYNGMEKPAQYCAWRMSFMIPAIQNAIKVIQTRSEDGSYGAWSCFDPIYAEKAYLIKKKTLLIPEEYLKGNARKYKNELILVDINMYGSPIDKETINEKYKFKHKIASREEISKAMDNKEEDVCILFKTASAVHILYVYDPSIKEVVYSDFVEDGPYLGKLELKHLNNKVTDAKELKKK